MDIETARTKFARRYYLWALEDVHREIVDGLPMLGRIKGRFAYRAVAFLQGRDIHDQIEIASALVKRFHAHGLAAAGESMTAREEKLVEQWLSAATKEVPDERSTVGAPVPSSIRKAAFRRLVTACLKERWQSEFEELNGTTLQTRWSIGGWSFVTTVGFGARPFYFHGVWAGQRAPLEPSISCLTWLGIAGQSVWDLLRQGDEEEGARSLAAVAFHFSGVVPKLLDGLEHDVQASDAEPSTSRPTPRLVPKK